VETPQAKTLPRVDDRPYRKLSPMPPVHCAKVPLANPEVVGYFEEKDEEVTSLGFVKGEQEWPEMNPATEERSLVEHLKLYGSRVKSITGTPTSDEKSRVVRLLSRKLEHNKYEPTVGYKNSDNLLRIIDSNLVNEKKSAGAPYQSEGMATNGDVLKKLGKQGLVDRVLHDWNDEFMVKWFLKAEPNKKKKLEKHMPRGVAGFPIHKMIKNQAIFRPMLENAVENWKMSPVKYAFSPGNPGHCEHLDSLFEGRHVYESDKSNWDFNMFPYFFEVLSELVVELAV